MGFVGMRPHILPIYAETITCATFSVVIQIRINFLGAGTTPVLTVMRALSLFLLSAISVAANAQVQGISASDTLGAEDLYGNPSFIGGVANGGGTAHGVW